jgi:secreted PhoX family phosphatase
MRSLKQPSIIDPTRRAFLRKSFAGMGWMVAGGALSQCTSGDGESNATTSGIANLGPLQEPDENGIRLPAGFTSRVVARTGERVTNSSYTWHPAPDGGAVFSTDDGGYIYVSNSEYVPGGVGAIRFSTDGEIVDAYGILNEPTIINCAGGITPWGTWLSCEEVLTGRVFECDPTGSAGAVVRPAMGIFQHEAAAIDEANRHAYMTEDLPDGRFYRFAYDEAGDLSSGQLQVAEVLGRGPEGEVVWRAVDDPSAETTPTKDQVPSSTPFAGGEGVWFHQGVVYFSTKGDNRVWAYDTDASMLTLIYDFATSDTPILSGVDNVTVSPTGDILVAEDGGNMEIVAILPNGSLKPLVQVTGQNGSEITGPAFDPTFRRLYFSSQRGPQGVSEAGITYEVTGPFFA